MAFVSMIGCDDTTFGAPPVIDSGAVVSPGYATDIEPIWLYRCTGCHTGGGAQAGLVLDGGAELIIAVPSSEAPGVLLVAPGDLGDSYIMAKIEGAQDALGGTGTAMPPGDPLPEAEIVTVSNWIEGLAPGE